MRSTLVIGAIAGAVLGGFLAAPAGAAAAKPSGAVRYLGFEGSETAPTVRPVSAEVRVNADRGELIGGSYVTIDVGCGRARKIALAGTSVHRGSFAKTKRRGAIRYRLRGRFVTRAYASFRYSASSPARARASARCQSAARTGALYQRGEPPFTGCRSQRAQTDVQNDDGRAFEQLRFVADDAEFVPFAYACLFSADKRVPLGPNGESMELTLPRVVAPFVAFAVANCPGASCYSTVVVRNLQDGRVVNDLAASMTGGPPGTSEHVTDLELKPNGSLAWLVQLSGPSRRTIEVLAVDASGRRLLETGPDVDPESLTLDGSTLSWLTGGVTHSATLD
jgi:hypothetical protein